MRTYLLEIGVEELPARFVGEAAASIVSAVVKGLDDAGLRHGEPSTIAAPRRVGLWIDVEVETAEQRRTVMGPPARVAFDADRKPTKAALAFAGRAKVPIEQLERVETERGVYLAAQVTEGGRPALEFLPGIARQAIRIDVPKAMRWGDVTATFARPVQWICCLFGADVVDVVLGDVRSGRTSRGHRFHHPAAFELGNASEYAEQIRQRRVIADPTERGQLLDQRLEACAREAGGSPVPVAGLRDEVLFLVEEPNPVHGSFPEAFLTLPEEVLMQEMHQHQRYFPLRNADGALLPSFVAVSNTAVTDPTISVRGYERVLRARLADARFFFDEDRKHTLAARRDALGKVVFHHELGSVAEKAERMEAIAAHLANAAGHTDLGPTLSRAAALAKVDLVTLMVGEFPELQGVMGREYARHDGEPEAVAVAIWEHYLPRGADDDLPQQPAGALLGLADRLDGLCGLLAVGEGPTSTKDPFALRRACIGTIRVAVELEISFSLRATVGLIESLLSAKLSNAKSALRSEDLCDAVLAFFRARMKAAWAKTHRADVVEAVLEADCDDIFDAHGRTVALAELSKQPGFDVVAALFKRVVNILRKEGAAASPTPVDHGLLREPAEVDLHQAVEAKSRAVREMIAGRRFADAFGAVGELQAPVARFFDDVLVVVEDQALRANRLALLASIAALFTPLADFSVLSLAR